MKVAMLAVTAVACSQPAPRQSEHPDGNPDVALTDIQEECRARSVGEIGGLNSNFGPMCGGPTMPAALHLFDFGSRAGEHEAVMLGLAMDDLCICQTAACDDPTRSRVIRDAADIPKRKEREFNGAVAKIVTDFSSHRCLDATVAADLFASGFACGYRMGLGAPRMEQLRQRIEKQLTEVGLDQAAAATLSESCTKLE